MSDELKPIVSDDARADGAADPQDGVTKPVSRRAALKVLGTVPIAGAMMGSSAFAQQGTAAGAQQPKQTHEAPFPPEHGQGTPPKSAPKRAFFTAAEWRTVGVLADDIIPRDGKSGSATDAGVPAFIDYHLSVPEASEDTRVAVRGGLAWLNTESRRRFRRNYATLSQAQRHQILDDIAWPKRAKPEFSHGTAFFTRMRDLVGMAFFSSAIGWKDLQYVGNVFNPDWKGCPEPAMQKLGVSFALMDTRIKPE
ncbi:MAG TPA: gluconate 2-dehydrogenase subunit 3 family protein [Gemmatimonadaceae bacterium]|nr:gluconate 2-dehydrogenase subunit 3 family protein [Gemmatimonadaceae bacterium]